MIESLTDIFFAEPLSSHITSSLTKSYVIILQQNHTSLYSHVLQQNHNTSSCSHTLQQNHPPQYMLNHTSYSYGHRSDTLSLHSLAILGSDDPRSTNLLISCSTFITRTMNNE